MKKVLVVLLTMIASVAMVLGVAFALKNQAKPPIRNIPVASTDSVAPEKTPATIPLTSQAKPIPESNHEEKSLASIVASSDTLTKESMILSNSEEEFRKIFEDPYSDPIAEEALIFKLALNNRGDNQAAEILKNFIQSPVPWGDVPDDKTARHLILAKSRALDAMGAIGTPEVEAYLKQALTLQGAEAITNDWLPQMPDNQMTDQNRVLGAFRGLAALGLAYYSQDPQIHDIIAAAFTQEKSDLHAEGYVTSPFFGQLADAMSRMQIIQDLGISGQLALYNDPRAMNQVYLAYYEKNNYRQ